MDVDGAEIAGNAGTQRDTVDDEERLIIAEDRVPAADDEFGMTVRCALDDQTRDARKQ
jgi:hypothetical protein